MTTPCLAPLIIRKKFAGVTGGRENRFSLCRKDSKEKDLDTLNDAIRLTNAEHETETVFAFTGEGPYLKDLKKMDIPNAVFTGFLQKEALAQVYASSDVFVFPSGSETFGNVVLEAMSSGLPVVCTDSGA